MMEDRQLLQEYAQSGSEGAFAELVRRHIDLVYSTALRQVGDAQLAKDVAQSVFIQLARKAGSLRDGNALPGWLYRVTGYEAVTVIRSEQRRRRRESEAMSRSELEQDTSCAWTAVAPLLEEAMGHLKRAEQDALILRFFENQSLAEVGHRLGVTEEAARKRVSRALEQLRAWLARRGLTVSASVLGTAIAANAVQATPVGLAATITSVAALAGSAAHTSALIAGTKLIAMTTMQKTLITATLSVAVGAGFYEARQAWTAREQVQALQQQETANAETLERITQERDSAVARQGALQEENERLRREVAEVPRLRAEVTRLRAGEQHLAQGRAGSANGIDPFTQSVLALTGRASELNRQLAQRPDKSIPELQFLSENDWLNAAREARFETEADVRKALSHLRSLAKAKVPLAGALNKFIRANSGQLPVELSQLKPYFRTAAEDGSRTNGSGYDPASDDAALSSLLERYTLVQSGNVTNLPAGAWIVVEKAPVDKEYDSRAKFGNGTSTIISTGLGEAGDPDDRSY